MSDRIRKLYGLGQSVWYDNIQRRLLENGELKKLIDEGQIYGITSNPSIFQKAIAETSDYDAAIQPMTFSGLSAEDIFYELAIEDIRAAADLFSDLYTKSDGRDGFVSLEVNPLLANNVEGTIKEAAILWKKVNRPNLMVKIPATKEGLLAIRRSIADGININITLIFALERYTEVIEAYLAGLEDRLARGLPIDKIASVASFFVSRVDTKIDGMLNKMVEQGQITAEAAQQLMGKAGIANSHLAYHHFNAVFTSQRFTRLKAAGAQPQRPLWASTSTKNPAYSDVMYVDELIAPDTVNTLPPQTLTAFQDHGDVKIRITAESDNSQQIIDNLEKLGIKMQSVTRELEDEGVAAFSKSFAGLLETLKKKATA